MAASSDNSLATPAAPRVHEQPFGDNKLTIPTGAPDTDANHYAFLDTDKETATDHADFRQYSNAQGRWMAPDPYDGSYDPNNPQSLNRYVYAMNSPASDLDPSGLWSLQASAVCSFCSSIWNAIRNIFSSVGDEDGGSSGGGGGGGGGTIDVNSPYMQYNDPMNYVNPTTTVWGPSSFGSGGGGVGGNAPNNGKPPDPYKKRMFGTHWCGPGGEGPTVNSLDAACKAHDQCYDANGLTAGSNFNPFMGAAKTNALQQCNQT